MGPRNERGTWKQTGGRRPLPCTNGWRGRPLLRETVRVKDPLQKRQLPIDIRRNT